MNDRSCTIAAGTPSWSAEVSLFTPVRRRGVEFLDEDRDPVLQRRSHRDIALFFDCADVDAACAVLRSRGLNVPDPVVRDYDMKQLYFYDPDGYEICFQHR